MNGNSNEVSETFYAAGYVRRFLDDYSRSCTLSADELAQRVATLLLAQTGGEILGTKHRVSSLRGKSAEGDKAPRKMALVGRPRRQASVTCRVCGKTLPSRSKYMKHRIKAHPELHRLQVQKMKAALQRKAA